jgi:integrase/recombinase XerD
MKDIEREALDAKPCENQEKDRAREKLVDDFASYLKALNRCRVTVRAYVHCLRLFSEWAVSRGMDDFRCVRKADLETYQADLVRSARYTISTIHIMMRSIRRFYEFLEVTGKVLVNPAAGFTLPKLGDRLPKAVLTCDEVRRMLDAPDTTTLSGIRDRAVLEVLYSTGMRVGELSNLTIGDVDIGNHVLRVNKGKGAKDRVVPLGQTAAEWVKRYLQEARSKFAGKLTVKELFLGCRGVPLINAGVGGIVKTSARKAGIEKWVTPHTMRHTCATHMMASGADIIHVQHLLGHVDISTTQIYVKVAQREVKEMHVRCHPSEQDNPPQFLPVPHKLRETNKTGDDHVDE